MRWQFVSDSCAERIDRSCSHSYSHSCGFGRGRSRVDVAQMVSFTERLKIALQDQVLPGFLFRWRAALKGVPDSELYNPRFQPWRGPSEFKTTYNEIRRHTLVTPKR